jgi:hypothetical protein
MGAASRRDAPLSSDTPQHFDSAHVERAKNDAVLHFSQAGGALAAVPERALERQNRRQVVTSSTPPPWLRATAPSPVHFCAVLPEEQNHASVE